MKDTKLFTRTAGKRLQKLTAFLTAAAMVAGFIPFQVLNVFADTNNDFNIVIDDHTGVFKDDEFSVGYYVGDSSTLNPVNPTAAENNGKKILSFSIDSADSHDITLKFDFGSNIEWIQGACIAGSPDATAWMGLDPEDPDGPVSVVKNEPAFTYHYTDYTTSDRCFCFEFFGPTEAYPNYFEVRAEGYGTLDFDKDSINFYITEDDNHVIKVITANNTFPVTFTPAAAPGDGSEYVLGNIIFRSEDDEKFYGSDHDIDENGISYTAGTNTLTLTMPEGSHRFDNVALSFTKSFTTEEPGGTININTPVVIDCDCCIYDCTLAIGAGGSILIKPWGNLMLGGGLASITGITAANFTAEPGASLSFFDNAKCPAAITLYDSNGDAKDADTVYDNWTEFGWNEDADTSRWEERTWDDDNHTTVLDHDDTLNEELVIRDGEEYRIKNCILTIGDNGSIHIENNGRLVLMGTADIAGIDISPDTANFTYYDGAVIVFENADNPDWIDLYNDAGEPMTDDHFGYEQFSWRDGDEQWKQFFNPDPCDFTVFVDSSLIGSSLTYTVKDKVHGGTAGYAPVEYRIDEHFMYPDNVDTDTATVTIDNDQRDLKELAFSLPDRWNNDAYPHVDIEITIPKVSALTLDKVFFGDPEDPRNEIKFTANETDYVIELTDIDITQCPHDIHLSFNNSFDRNSCFGLDICMQMDNTTGFSRSDDGKLITYTAYDGNQLVITNDDTMYVEYIEGRNETDPSLYRIWAMPDDESAGSSVFGIAARASEDYVAYVRYTNASGEDVTEALPADGAGIKPYAVVSDTKGSAVKPDLSFEKNSLNFGWYDNITPAPGNGDDWKGDLTGNSFVIEYEHGTVTVELLGEGSTWFGRTEKRDDDMAEADVRSFRIETRAQVQLTFDPAEGYEIDPFISDNYEFNENSLTTAPFNLSTENNHIDNPFRVEGSNPPPVGLPSAVFEGATGIVIDEQKPEEVVVNYVGGSVKVEIYEEEGTPYDGERSISATYDDATDTAVIVCTRGIKITLITDQDHTGSAAIGNNRFDDFATLATLQPNTNVDVRFIGSTFIFGIGGFDLDTSRPPVETGEGDEKKVTVYYEHGRAELTGYVSYLGSKGVRPAGSFQIGSYEITFEGTELEVNVYTDNGYMFHYHLDGTLKYDDGHPIEFTDIAKGSKFSFDLTIDELPELTIGSGYSFDSQTGELTFRDEGDVVGRVTIDGNPFSNPQQPNQISSNVVFKDIWTADGYSCFAILNNGQQDYIAGDTYTLELSRLSSNGEVITAHDGQAVRINNCAVTVASASGLSIDNGCTLILDGAGAGIEGFDKIAFSDGARLAFKNGAGVPEGITLYDSDGTAELTGPFAGYTEFSLNGTKWVKTNGNEPDNAMFVDTARTLGGSNTLVFSFERLPVDSRAKIKLDGSAVLDGENYKITCENGYVLIPASYIEGEPVVSDGTTVFTVALGNSEVEIKFYPDEDYRTILKQQYGSGDDTWTNDLTVTGGETYDTYSVAVNPRNNEPEYLKVSFDNSYLHQANVTYTYTGCQASISIGGNAIPDGLLNNRTVEFRTPLAPEEGKVEFKIAVPFNYFMSELVINDVDYSDQLPKTTEELLNAFAGQYTGVTIMVPAADSYTISTAAGLADPEHLAIGNFLWFYEEGACEDPNDMVRNARLEIVSVNWNGETYSGEDLFVGAGFPGSGLGNMQYPYMEWDENIRDGQIVDGTVVGGRVVNGEAVLPAGSEVTIRLIPDYGMQLVGLGVNAGNFDVEDDMYTYTFTVGHGNFHLFADFEPVEDVVQPSATAVDSGLITLGENTISNGTAVLSVDNADPAAEVKELFEAEGTVSSYLDISLDRVVYQAVDTDEVVYSGEGANVWSERLGSTTPLSAPATIELVLEDGVIPEGVDPNNVTVLHEKHDGKIETINGAVYDPDNNTLTFQASSFSNYAIAYESVEYYDLWVGGTQVTSANAANVLRDTGDPTVVYDADTNTLTLNGATITGPVRESASDYDADGGIIYAGEDDFTINVIGGTTTVTGSNTERGTSAGLFFGNPEDVWSDFKYYDVTIDIAEGATLNLVGGVPDTTNGYPSSCGLDNTSFGTLTITGSGTLNATGGASKFSYGIDTMQTLIIDGPTVNASGADSFYSAGIYAFNVTVDSGTLTASGGHSEEDGAESYGIDAYSSGATALVINEGAVTATGYTSALHAPATLADGVTAGGSTNIDGTGAVSYVAADNSSYKWFGTPFTINYDLWVGGIQVTSANASNVLGDTGTPTVVYDASTNTLTLNGATITGPDSEVLGWNAGGGIVYSGTEDFTIKVTGGTSTVTGGNNRDRSAGLLIADPRYVFSGSSNPCKTTIIIDEGATLTLFGGVPNSYGACSVGLLCDTTGGLTITGSGTLNAAGSGASNIDVSYGIHTQKKLTIDGPTVNASGADSYVSVGIYSNYGLIIENGTVTTTAGYSARNGAWSYGVMANNGFAINGGTVTAKSYISALNTSVTLGDGVTASGSINMNGSDAVSYVAADNASYKWFSTTFTPLTYGISLDKTGTYTFTEATVGYSALTPATVTVTNTGTGATGNLSVALSGTDASSFTLSKTSLSGLSANGSDTFTIVPKDGLAAKTYTATVTVSGENDISATFNVSFTVNPLYTVTFNANGHGMNPDALQVAYNGRATRPDDPVATGYTFGGWYTNSACTGEAYDFSTAVTADIKLYAKWTPVNYTVSVDEPVVGGTVKVAMADENYVSSLTAHYENTVNLSVTADPGYVVDTILINGTGIANTSTSFVMPAEDVTVVVTFKPIVYTVTFSANGHGTAPAALEVAYHGRATRPADPAADGFIFGGWFTDSACTKAYDFSKGVTANITLYAKWTPSVVPSSELLIGGSAHVQDFGDRPVKVDPSTGIMTIGTRGQAKRLEEILIDFQNTTGYTGGMEYRVHVQDIGWMDWTPAGTPAGTEGLAKRLEAIEIRLTGELAKHYSVEYCAHIQDYGDAQGWVRDGALAGTTGESKRIEEIKVRIVPIGRDNTTSVNYRVHVQDYGWENKYVANGAMSGTSGQSKRLEGIEIHLSGCQYTGGIRYRTHIQNIGWESTWARDGEMSGTQGKALRLEAIQIELYGDMAAHYDIYYRVHAQDIGWMSWASNGAEAGTAARSARLEGIQIVLVPKGSAAPGKTYQGITAVDSRAFVNGF